MNSKQIKTLSSKKLVKNHVQLCLLMYDAVEIEDSDEYNTHFRKMMLIEDELKSRPGDHRHLLLPLLTHENPQVRLHAIKSTLAVRPKAARKALEKLAKSDDDDPYDFEARVTVDNLDSGFWVPD